MDYIIVDLLGDKYEDVSALSEIFMNIKQHVPITIIMIQAYKTFIIMIQQYKTFIVNSFASFL